MHCLAQFVLSPLKLGILPFKLKLNWLSFSLVWSSYKHVQRGSLCQSGSLRGYEKICWAKSVRQKYTFAVLSHLEFWSSCDSVIPLPILLIRVILNNCLHVWKPQFPMGKMKDLEQIVFKNFSFLAVNFKRNPPVNLKCKCVQTDALSENHWKETSDVVSSPSML